MIKVKGAKAQANVRESVAKEGRIVGAQHKRNDNMCPYCLS
jgi:hypothetical protein